MAHARHSALNGGCRSGRGPCLYRSLVAMMPHVSMARLALADRPFQATSIPNIMMAGDWVRGLQHGANGLSQVCACVCMCARVFLCSMGPTSSVRSVRVCVCVCACMSLYVRVSA